MSGVLFGYAEKLWDRTSAEYRTIVVAFIFAPAAALFLIWAAGPTRSTKAAIAPPVNIISLRTRAGGTPSALTTVVIVQPADVSFRLPSSTPLNTLPTSLAEEQWRMNAMKISTANNEISVTAPLNGVQDPFIFVTQDAAPEALEISGQRYALADMRLRTQQATDILLGVLVSAAFALGIGVSTAAAPVQVQEHGSG